VRRALALLLLVLPLAACGGSDVTSLDPIAQAADKTTDVAGAHFVLNARIAAQGETVAFEGPGEIGDHGEKLHMRLSMPASILGIQGAGKGNVTFEAIGAGKYFYFRGGPFDQLSGGKWVRMKDDDPSFNLGQNDPSKMLEYLRATSEIDEVGEDTVRGAHTTHYDARINLDKVAERVSPEAAQALEQATKTLKTKEIPLDVWIDDDGLVRRLTMDWHPAGGTFTLSLDLFDFGEVDIDVPSAAETTDLSKLMGGG
jgi:hypothetical protein